MDFMTSPLNMDFMTSPLNMDFRTSPLNMDFMTRQKTRTMCFCEGRELSN